MVRPSHALLVLSIVLTACGDTDQNNGPTTDSPHCVAPAGVDASPNSIMDVVALIDALPKPVSVACFVESLERPMSIIGSVSTFSAQPAVQGSPRIFAVYDKLIMSWVPMGDGSEVLEFAEERGDVSSIKAEIHMPVTDTLTYADFEHINDTTRVDMGTICGACHRNEEPVDDIPLGLFYQSDALRPSTAETVRVETMRDLHDYCDPAYNAARCDILSATFDHGEVLDTDFPRILPSIYD